MCIRDRFCTLDVAGSSSFDRVLIGGGITYFKDPARALSKAARVVVEGGRVVVFEQVTAFERLLRKASPPLKLAPPLLRPSRVRWLYGGRLYLASFEKEAWELLGSFERRSLMKGGLEELLRRVVEASRGRPS